MKPVPHGEPYAGNLHVRFDEGYPQSRRRVAKRCRGADVPDEGCLALLYTLGVHIAVAGGEKNRYLPGKQYRILRKGKAVIRV